MHTNFPFVTSIASDLATLPAHADAAHFRSGGGA